MKEGKFNVVFVSNHSYPYGMASSKRIRLFAENLPTDWNRAVVVTGTANGRNSASGEYNGVPYKLVLFNKFSYLLNPFKAVKVLREAWIGDARNILFLYSNVRLTNFWFAVAGRIQGYKVVTDIVEDMSVLDHKTSTVKRLKVKFSVLLQRFLGKLVDGGVVISTGLYSKHKDELDKIELIPISAENLDTHLEKGNSEGPVRFVYSGTFRAKDGLEGLIRAFTEEVKPSEGILMLSGQASQELEALIKPFPHISFNGLIADNEYYQYLKDADVLLMTRTDSVYANTGFPFKLGEYLATGNPVISTSVGDVTKYLTDKVEVVMAKPSDERSLRAALRFVLDNPDQAREIGMNGKKACEEYFNPKRNGELLAGFLRKM